MVLDDYRELYFAAQGADSNRSGESINWEQFKSLYSLVLKNQSQYFREVYNDKNLGIQQHHIDDNDNSIKEAFNVYDDNSSGYLDFVQLQNFLRDLNLHRQFALHWNADQAFDGFCNQMWRKHDKNMDGKISFDEFVDVYNTVLDR